jgi:hypothetical protein
MKTWTIDGYWCILGENANENWDLLGKAKSYYNILHLSRFPSGYFFICYDCNKLSIPDRTVLKKCCDVFKAATKYKNMNNIKIDCTTCSNVTKCEQVGELVYKSNKKVLVISV